MTDDALVWVAAGVQVLTATGIVAFWLTWFREAHTEEWLPTGYVEHERVFVYPDSLLAALLVLSAGLAVLEVDLGRSLGLVSAGMLLFLGVIDLAYFAQHRMFARARGGLVNAGVVVGVLVASVLLVVAYA
jgi:hypothetical protein